MARPLQTLLASSSVQLASAVAALALPPPTYGIVPELWNKMDGSTGTYPEVEIDVWGDGARALTAATLYGARLHPFTFTPITVTAVPAVKASLDLSTKTTHCNTIVEAKPAGESGNLVTIAFVPGSGANAGSLDESAYPVVVFHYKTGVTTVANFEAAIAAAAHLDVKTPGTAGNVLADPADTFTATALAGGDDSELNAVAHGLLTGDGQVQVQSTGTIPAGLAALTGYYVVKDDADNIGLAATLADALAGNVIEFTGAGTGVITLVAVASTVASTQRVHWHSLGLLGLAADGVISVDAQSSYWDVRRHSPRTVAYAIVATFGAGTGKVSAEITPRLERS